MKLFKLAVLAVWLFACGAPLEEDEALDLEQAEQPVSVEVNGYGWNSTSGSNNLKQCAGGDTAQTCNVPLSRTVRINLNTAGMIAGDVTKANAQISALVTAYNNQFSANGWALSTASSNIQVQIQKGTIGNLVPGTQDIRNYLGLSCTSFATLTETVDGTYRSCGSITATIDFDKLGVEFGIQGSAPMTNVIKHTIGVAIQARLGIGVQSSDSSRISFRTLSATAARNSTMSSKEQCRVKALVTGGGSVAFTNNC